MAGAPLAISGIVLGGRAGRDTGSVQKLARSIAADGMACPVTISRNNRLITGVRRLVAHQVLGRRDINAIVISTMAEALDALLSEQADGRHAIPMTLAETMQLDMVMRDELEWWPRAGSGRRVTRSGGHNAEVAAVLGLNQSQYSKARELYTAALGYRDHNGRRIVVAGEDRENATAAAARLRHKSQIIALHEWYKKGAPDDAHLLSRRRPPPRDQADSITSALGTLRGLSIGLREVDFADLSMTPAQAAQWQDDLAEGLSVLRAFQRKLKEIT